MSFGHLSVNPRECIRRLGASFALLLVVACNPGPMPNTTSSATAGEEENAGRKALADDASEKAPDFEVKLRLSTQSGAALTGNDPTGFGLQTASFVEFSVKNCASGYALSGLGAAQDSFQLYRFDQSCKVFIDSFALDGEFFEPMPGQPFNPNLHSENQFIGDAGRMVTVKVLEQLPQILDTLDANASFFIQEKSAGRNFQIEIYSVGLATTVSQFVESATTTVPVTVRRGLPARGTLKVALEVSGTATPVLDLTTIPSEVEFQDGVSAITFYVRALPDDPYDDLETLTISIKPGLYFIADPKVDFTVRDQSYSPPVWTQTVGTQSVQDDSTLSFTVNANDPNGDPVYYSIDSTRTTCGPGWSPTLSINQSGLVYGVPRDAAVGTCLLALAATSLGGMITHDVIIHVLDRPESPEWTILPPTLRIYEGESLDVNFVATDPDPNASVSYSLDPASTCLGFSWNPIPTIGTSTGRLQGTPSMSRGGRCSFVVRAQSQGVTITTEFQLEIARRTLVWVAPSGIPYNTCVPVSLKLTDGLDQFIEAPVTATISLDVNNGTGSFHDSNSCSSSSTINAISFPASANEIFMYFKTTTSNQSLTLVATGGTYESGYFNLAVGSTPSRLLVAGPTRIGVNQCMKYRVDVASSGNVKVITTSNRSVSLSLGSGMRAYADNVCSDRINSTVIPAYETGTEFYVEGTRTGNRNIRASSSGLSSGNLSVQVVSSRSWWNSGWPYRLWIQLDNSDQSTTFTNQPVLIKLTPERFPYAQAKADGSDLRFINSSDSTVLPHQIEEWIPGGTSLIWVRVDEIPASSSSGTIQLYFGNAAASSVEQASTLWSAYAGIWHLNESPIQVAPQFKDSTSNGRHGRAMANPKSLQGPIGNSIGFMGTLDHIEINGYDLAPILGRTATFSAWIKTAQTGSNIGWSSPALTGVEHNGTPNDIQYGWLDDTGRIGVTAGDNGSVKSDFVVNDSTWRHVTITRNESNGAIAFYINGVLNGSGSSESGFKSTPFNRFGVLWDTSGTHKDFNGYMDEIRIYSGVMSAARIEADYKYMVDTHVYYLMVEEY
ncbi:DUF2341 domain-containing protein [Oligoflexus tunisiensis]|uniref:DUF2341 domain-containing protein n=1 Tax=Oligoflexus tunisiensis TaxID=708132 RepID=UPI00159F2872|nr:DUF2341 domain-containing protein [Oligoflexus tunisiensis]